MRFLNFGSETPDNMKCAKNVEYGQGRDKSSKSGLKIKKKNLFLSDIMYAIEDMDLPKEVKAEYPKLTANEWEAATRMITMILIALESDV
jgi:hypothetical protein